MTELLRLHVLVAGAVEAHPAGLVAALREAGFQVDEIPEGADLEQAMAQGLPDAVLLCVRGAGEAATGAVRTFKDATHWSDVTLIGVTGGGRGEVAALLRAGADDALGAPVEVGLLRARLDRQLQLRQEMRELRATLRSRDLLFDIFQEVSAALRAEEIFQTLVRRVGQALGLAHCSFVLTAPGERQGRVVAVFENPSMRDVRIDLDRYPELQEALRTERPVVVENIMEHPLFAAIRERWAAQSLDLKIRSAVALPVFVHGAPAGVFFLRTRHGDQDLTARDVELADTIARAATKVLENEERRAAIYRRQAGAGVLDELTGCATLDALDRRLKDEYERARRYRLRFCVVLLDIDQFREVNARLGAQAGDRVLADLGHLLQRELRSPDFVARYGGDEFALVLPETDARGARNFVQRLRGIVAKQPFADLGGDHPKFSAGIVSFPHQDVLRPEDLIALAEHALARAKQTPEDRIAIALSSAA